MENGIADKNVYLARMSRTFLDKAFFLKDLPESINRIVDVGCADGSFLDFIEKLFPGRFELIGVENNDDLREIAEKKHKVFDKFDLGNILGSFDFVFKQDRLNTCVNFSSVFHEIINYSGMSEFNRMVGELTTRLPVGAVSIRDMSFTFLYPSFFSDNIRANFTGSIKSNMSLLKDGKYHDKFTEVFPDFNMFNEITTKDVQSLVEFLLKYMYTENWNRESSEKYFNWFNSLSQMTSIFNNNGYCRYVGETFKVPYLVRRWKKDWNLGECDCFEKWIQLFDTHYRALFVNKEIVDK